MRMRIAAFINTHEKTIYKLFHQISFQNYSTAAQYDCLNVYQYPTSVNFETTTSNRLQDGFGWYHYVLRVDTTQGSAANRVRQY